MMDKQLFIQACSKKQEELQERIDYILDIKYYIVQPLKDKGIIDAADIVPQPKWGFNIYLYKNEYTIKYSITYSMLEKEDPKEIEKIMEDQCLLYTHKNKTRN